MLCNLWTLVINDRSRTLDIKSCKHMFNSFRECRLSLGLPLVAIPHVHANENMTSPYQLRNATRTTIKIINGDTYEKKCIGQYYK